MKLSVIIPAYNEEKNLDAGSLTQVNDYLKKQPYEYEVLIVDDGSTDQTSSKIKDMIKDMPGFRLIEAPHGGKALTVILGMKEAKGEIALFTDMDQSTPIKEVEKFFPKFESGFDIVIGSREGRKGSTVVRKVISLGFAVLRLIILGMPFKDTQCGFKAFDKTARENLFPKVKDRWKKSSGDRASVNAGFDVELLFLAKRTGYKIAEVTVEWHHAPSERVHAVRDALETIRDLFRVRFNAWSGEYN
ncbi:MAG: glycosyltransferase [Candidatus Paceibacterales bacterium]